MAQYGKGKKAEKPKQVVNKSPADTDFEQAVENRRVKNVEGGRTIFNRFVQDDVARSNICAQTRNQMEGGRPYDPNELIAQGAAGSCNVNFGDAQSSRDRTLLPYWRMVNDVPHRANITVESMSPEAGKWGVAAAEVFDLFHEDWGADYYIQFMKLCKNFVDFGPGMGFWEDPEESRYKAINVQRVYWPKNTQMSPDEWEVMAFVRDVSASELYKKIRNKDVSRQSAAAGWNEKAIKQAIVQMKDGGQFPDYRDYTRYQDLLVNNDIVITSPFQPLTCVWLYVRNFDGKIGCYVFPQNTGVDDFLYEDDEASESFRHLMGAIWYDTGTDGMVHSIKGFGIKNFYFSALVNRVKSRMVDAGTLAMAINFQYNDDNVPDESPPVENYGSVNLFPPGLKQLAIYPQLQQAGGVLEMLQANRDQNNSLYAEATQQAQIENTDTATQAKILTNMQGQMSEASAAVFLSQLAENIFSEQIRRMRMRGNKNKDAVAFVRRLQERGVPDEAIFDSQWRVKTGASAGMGNPLLMTQKFKDGLTLALATPGMNARWFQENVVAYEFGSQAVAKAFLPPGVESEPGQRRQARQENIDFGNGAPLGDPPLFGVIPEDAHFEHVQEHLKPLIGIAQAFEQTGQMTPETLAAATIGMEHAGVHMGFLAGDETKKAQLQAVTPQFRLVQSTIRGILQRQMQMQQGTAAG